MQEISAERLHAILESEAVMDVIHELGRNPAIKPVLADRAHEALQVAVELAENAQKDLTDEALTSIAIAAVRSIDPEQDEYHLRHVVVSWLGPVNVPDNLRFSWEPRGKKGEKTGGAAIPEITPERGAELVTAQNQGALADKAVLAYADVYKAVGRIEAATFFAKIGNISAAQFAVQVREGKRYKGMPYDDKDGNRKYISTFDEFCEHVLGKSGRHIRELVSNLHTLGPELYEAAEQTGFRTQDYAALKALPESEQEVVKQALAADSKEQVLDILQDLAARHQSERAAAKKQAEDLKADLDARDKVLADKGDRLDKISMELEKLKSLPPNKRARLQLEQEQVAAERINTACVKAEVEVNAFLSEVADVLALDELSITTTGHANNAVRFLCESIVDFLQAHNIDVDFAGMARPEWLREQAADDLGLREGK